MSIFSRPEEYMTLLIPRSELSTLEEELARAKDRLGEPWNYHNRFPHLNVLEGLVQEEREKYYKELGI